MVSYASDFSKAFTPYFDDYLNDEDIMETHILFFILAGLLIAILIGYSLWSARREKSRIFSNTFSTRPVSTPIGSQQTAEIPQTLNQENFTLPIADSSAETPEQQQAHRQEIDNQVKEISITLPGQTEPHYAEPEPIFTATPPQSEPIAREEVPLSVEQTATVEQTEKIAQPNMIALYVVAPQGSQFNGVMVVQQLEALGLQYGEYQIFHRHVDNSNSPVLFSVANMMEPGIFEMSRIEHFSTVGLVFFMQLPSPTNDLANLRMMINAAESLAQTLGGFVLDEQQQLFDETARQHYLLRVKNS